MGNSKTKTIRWDLRRLECFVAVAGELHFGRAAKRLNMSQPPLTQQIQLLEHLTGVQLFRREHRTISLTNAGRVLYAEAQKLLAHSERLGQVVQSIKSGQRGHLSIACVPTALYEILPQIAQRFREAHPGVTLVLKEAHSREVIQALADREVDFGIVWGRSAPSLAASRVLCEGSFLAAMSMNHRMSHLECVNLRDLEDEPLILCSRKASPFQYESIISSFAELEISPRIAYEVPTLLSQIGYAASGFGIALLPSFARNLGIKGVCYRPVGEGIAPCSISLAWNADIDSAAAEAFLQVVDDAYPIGQA